MGKTFDCLNCVGICCSVYNRVEVSKRDINRIARHFRITPEAATLKYTKVVDGDRVLRRKKDELLGETCTFFDLDKRLCGQYEARPLVCRVWPDHGDGGCVYYDVLQFERDHQDTDTVFPLIQLAYKQDDKKAKPNGSR
ncbi:MAG: YkgJ family cysteine cluster protein [Blastocatellia bacterium]